MKIKILGAAGGEVTGSSYLVETAHAKVMIDAGIFQGSKATEEKNSLPEGVDPRQLDALLLTHAHLDHTGRVPLLLKHGYQNTIFATSPTLDLTEILLQDSARIQVQDANRKNRYHPEKHKEALYEPKDVLSFKSQGKIVELHHPVAVAEGVIARFYEAGHMLGSASIELTVQEGNNSKVIVFSGDLGPNDQPILRPFDRLPFADFVFLESTYGNRNHRPYVETLKEFEEIIQQAVEQKGKILIPAFAIGRTQQILYHLATIFLQKKINPFPVFVDSPMAIEAGKIYIHYPELFDEEAVAWRNRGILPLDPKWFKFITSVEESKELNDLRGPCVILAGSGMCNGGRIQHHLKFNLPSPTTHVLFVGYQGYGSLGRQLVDGAQKVKIHGELIEVKAKIHTLNGLSAHAGQNDLLMWLDSLAKTQPKIALTHGENPQRESLAAQIEKKFNLKTLLPSLNQKIEL